MKLVIQRVSRASVSVGGELVSEIGAGMMVLVGVHTDDTAADAEYLAAKTAALRIFDDEAGVMNLSVSQTGGEVLAVSQFTLLASTRNGNRPSYIAAMKGAEAKALYDHYCSALGHLLGREVKKGVFGADMDVELVNRGPVTIVIDTHENR